MLPRGKVLNKIPKLFNGISHVVIKAWDNKMYIVKTGNLIPFAERLLVSSPILILPFCCEKDSPEFVDVPLPDVSEPQTFLKDEHTLDGMLILFGTIFWLCFPHNLVLTQCFCLFCFILLCSVLFCSVLFCCHRCCCCFDLLYFNSKFVFLFLLKYQMINMLQAPRWHNIR